MIVRITHIPGTLKYKPGDVWRVCARCDFDYLRSELVKDIPTGLDVCKKCADELGYRQKMSNLSTISGNHPDTSSDPVQFVWINDNSKMIPWQNDIPRTAVWGA